jgi:predicted Rossmann fold nucleotide-binding protein DprA/Smf involved in DNA uptake
VTKRDMRRPVLRAVHVLRDRGAPPPTADEIAKYLRAKVSDVLPALVELKAAGILRDRSREGRREWRRR